MIYLSINSSLTNTDFYSKKNIKTIELEELNKVDLKQYAGQVKEYIVEPHGIRPRYTFIRQLLGKKKRLTLFLSPTNKILASDLISQIMETTGNQGKLKIGDQKDGWYHRFRTVRALVWHKLIGLIGFRNRLNNDCINDLETPPKIKIINVIHLYSCFSGAAQDCLENLSGNIILCTYSEPDETAIGLHISSFIEARINSDSLIKFIIDHLHLCAAVGFCITYKIDGEIFQYKITFDHLKLIKTNPDKKLDDLSSFLQQEVSNIKNFYSHLCEKFGTNYPENFPVFKFTDMNGFNLEKLTAALNFSLTNKISNNSSIDKINSLLQTGIMITPMSLGIAMDERRPELVKVLLKNASQVCQLTISAAITQKSPELLELLLKHPSVELTVLHVSAAITQKSPELLELLLKHPSVELTVLHVSAAITQKSPELLELLLQHPSVELTVLHVSEAITQKSPELLELLLKHPSVELTVLHVSEAITQKVPELLELLLQHPSAAVNSSHVSEAIIQKAPELLELLLQHPSATVNSSHVSEAIIQKAPELLELLLQHPSVELTVLHVSEAITQKAPELLELLLKHPSVELTVLHVSEAITQKVPEVLELLLQHPSAAVNSSHVSEAIIQKAPEVLEILLKQSSTIKNNIFYSDYSTTDPKILSLLKNYNSSEASLSQLTQAAAGPSIDKSFSHQTKLDEQETTTNKIMGYVSGREFSIE